MTDREVLLMCYGYLKAMGEADEFMLSLLASQLFGVDGNGKPPPPDKKSKC